MKSAATAIAALIASTNVASAREIHMPFLQAAIFFMFGVEGNAVQDVTHQQENLNNGAPYYKPVEEFRASARARVQAPVYTPAPVVQGRLPGHYVSKGIWEVLISEKDPCSLIAVLLSPQDVFNTNNPITGDGNGMRVIDFSKMPSPRTFQYHNPRIIPGMVANMYVSGWYTSALQNDTWCSYRTGVDNGEIKRISGSSLCRTQVKFDDNSELDIRRFQALNYIRANYCMGQPEPPIKPY